MEEDRVSRCRRVCVCRRRESEDVMSQDTGHSVKMEYTTRCTTPHSGASIYTHAPITRHASMWCNQEAIPQSGGHTAQCPYEAILGSVKHHLHLLCLCVCVKGGVMGGVKDALEVG